MKKCFFKNNDNLVQRGFTLIELLIVIAIIGILASIVLVSFPAAMKSARDANRKSDLKQLQIALEVYKQANGFYPVTGWAWWGVCANGGSRSTSGPNAYIPGLTPDYAGTLPTDPAKDLSGWSGYIYFSPDGSCYKLLDHVYGPESFPQSGQPFYDPVRPGWAWMVCSIDPACAHACNGW